MSVLFQFSREQLKIIDLAIGWFLYGRSSLTTRPVVPETDLPALHSLGETLFSLSAPESVNGSIIIIENNEMVTGSEQNIVPSGSLRLLILAVSTFIDELGRMDPEIEIVTGLPRARTEELQRYLESLRECGI